MKRLLFTAIFMGMVALSNAQVYQSHSHSDSYGNTTTTYEDRYGHTLGTAKSHTDSYGNTSTDYEDAYGHSTGSSRSHTDRYGNTSTDYNSSRY